MKMDKDTREFIRIKIKDNIKCGYPPKVAVAKAYSEARMIGFNVPDKKSLASRMLYKNKVKKVT